MILVLLVGCTDENVNKDVNKNVNNSLSMLDVITKAQQTMSKQKGYTADSHSDSKVDIDKLSMNTVTDLTIISTNNPQAFHSSGTAKTNTGAGDNLEIETYYVDGVIYQKINNQWMKLPSKSLYNLLDQNKSLGDSLKQFRSLVQIYQSGSKTDEITMTKTKSGDYQFIMDIKSTKGSEVLKKQVTDMLQNVAKSISAGQSSLENLQIHSFKETIIIDGKTFQFKNMDVASKMSMNSNGMNMAIEQKYSFVFKGAFNGKIEVPADVKSSAKGLNDQLLEK
jgi:hypothetical protein